MQIIALMHVKRKRESFSKTAALGSMGDIVIRLVFMTMAFHLFSELLSYARILRFV